MSIPDPTHVQLMVFDVDGVLTDGVVAYTNSGDELKHFYIKDGLALKAAQSVGVQVAIVTARKSEIVARRMKELGIENVVQGCKDKATTVAEIAQQLAVPLEATAFVGDDLVDLKVMSQVGYPIAVADAVAEVREAAVLVTTLPGGRGAVREAIEYVLRQQDKWDEVVSRYLA